MRIGNDVDARVVAKCAKLERLVALVRGRDHQGVTAPGQFLDDSFEMARLAEVVDEEQNLHDVFWVCAPAALGSSPASMFGENDFLLAASLFTDAADTRTAACANGVSIGRNK